MDLNLNNKVAIVTAGTSGIGLATAKSLHAEGAKVFITGRDREELIQAQSKIINSSNNSATVDIIQADVGTKAGCQTVINTVGSVDILINNLGPYYESNFLEQDTDEKLIELFEINVMSAARLSRHYLKKMLNNNSGRIIFIGSESVFNVYHNLIDYSVTKAALLALKTGLAELTVNTNVTINAVLPGPTMTEGVEEYFKGRDIKEETKKWFSNECRASLLKRWTTPLEIASLIILNS
jgi:short-subunit dehydrogenase